MGYGLELGVRVGANMSLSGAPMVSLVTFRYQE